MTNSASSAAANLEAPSLGPYKCVHVPGDFGDELKQGVFKDSVKKGTNTQVTNGPLLAQRIEDASNALAAEGYDVVSVQVLTRGWCSSAGGIGSSVAAGWSMSFGAIILGKRRLGRA